MKRIILVFALFFFYTNGSAQISDKQRQLNSLPECVEVLNGKLSIKKGFTGIVLGDGHTVQVQKLANAGGASGTFICACNSDIRGSCSVTINNNIIICGGSCNCGFTTTINNVVYRVDMKKGVLLKQ